MSTNLESAVENYVRTRSLSQGSRDEHFATLRKWNRWRVPLLSTPIHKCRMKRPSNQTLITHSAQLAPVLSTGASKYDYRQNRKFCMTRHQSDDSSGLRHAVSVAWLVVIRDHVAMPLGCQVGSPLTRSIAQQRSLQWTKSAS